MTERESRVESQHEEISRLEFDTLKPGDTVSITLGDDGVGGSLQFTLESDESGVPTGALTGVGPNGSIVEPVAFELHGCGRWTTRDQNPVQHQRVAFTPYYRGLIVGDLFWGSVVGDDERTLIEDPISKIEVHPSILP